MRLRLWFGKNWRTNGNGQVAYELFYAGSGSYRSLCGL